MSRNAGEQLPDCLTALSIDGNSISVASAERRNGRLALLAAEHHETGNLVEVIRRLRHPIFMDIDLCWFPNKADLEEALSALLRRVGHDFPVVAVMSPEKIRRESKTGPADESARAERRASLLASHLPMNPYDYPRFFYFRESLDPTQRLSETTLCQGRLTDILAYHEIIRHIGARIVGVMPGLSALQRMIHSLRRAEAGSPFALCDIGKLRTTYLVQTADGNQQGHTIPVGLARDDIHYFTGIQPVLPEIEEAQLRFGSLFLPPETTFSGPPSADLAATSPQIDLTRFADEIARYALRALGIRPEADIPPGNSAWQMTLAGRAARIPGLVDFLDARLPVTVETIFSQQPIDVDPTPGINPHAIGENLAVVGGLLDALLPVNAGSSMLPDTMAKLSLSGTRRTFAELTEDRLYVLEQKPGS